MSRSDFVQDDKWQAYLPLCNQLYFVAAPGIIQKGELSADVGLVETSKNCTRLYTRKKAAHRQIDPPTDLYEYLLMCRTDVVGPWAHQRVTTREQWQEWLDGKRDDDEFGRMLRGKIAARFRELVHGRDCENKRLCAENEKLANIARFLKAAQISPQHWDLENQICKQIERARSELPPGLIDGIASLERAMAAFRMRLSDLDTKEECGQ